MTDLPGVFAFDLCRNRWLVGAVRRLASIRMAICEKPARAGLAHPEPRAERRFVDAMRQILGRFQQSSDPLVSGSRKNAHNSRAEHAHHSHEHERVFGGM